MAENVFQLKVSLADRRNLEEKESRFAKIVRAERGVDRFVSAAQQLGCDENMNRFEEVLKKSYAGKSLNDFPRH
jgi:hypothetical protein